MTVVLDCNVLVMCLTSRSPFHLIYRALVAGQSELAVSTEIMLEYEEIISRKYGQRTAADFMALLVELPTVQLVTAYYRWNLIQADADDNKYCDCAVAAQADFLVTEDTHFNALASIPFPPVKTLGIDAFTELLQDTD